MKRIILLTISLVVMGVTMAQQTLHWTPGNYLNNMTVVGVITIDGVEQTLTTLEVGAFCGDECRGSLCASYFPPTQQYIATLTIGSDGTSGELITFRLYDHATSQELDLECTASVTFLSDDRIGYPGNWFQFSFVTPAVTFTLPITGYGDSDGGYYLIASPIEEEITPSTDNGFLTQDYDLYYFDQSLEQEWFNYKSNPFNLVSGKGYLYASKGNTELTFTGTPYNGDGTVHLDYDTNADFKGWNLVGNPFSTAASLDRSFYVMNPEGTEIIAATSTTVAAMQGIFVVTANADGEDITFNTSTTNGKSQVVLNVFKDRGATLDRAIVRFDENGTLPKFMLDSNNAKVYIPQNGCQYAVVNGDDENTLPVNFKAKASGTYTFDVDINEVEMEYLHLIDNLTGTDVDLLVQPDYQFTATSNDYEALFTLVFRAATGVEEHEQSFCFVNGRCLYFCENVEGACFSLIDMMGSTVRHETLKGNGVSVANLSEGMYVVRLANGEKMKTQKIVVK